MEKLGVESAGTSDEDKKKSNSIDFQWKTNSFTQMVSKERRGKVFS